MSICVSLSNKRKIERFMYEISAKYIISSELYPSITGISVATTRLHGYEATRLRPASYERGYDRLRSHLVACLHLVLWARGMKFWRRSRLSISRVLPSPLALEAVKTLFRAPTIPPATQATWEKKNELS